MIITVQELIGKLQGFPPEAEIAIESSVDDQEFFIASFNLGGNGDDLTIVISGKEEEEDPDDETNYGTESDECIHPFDPEP